MSENIVLTKIAKNLSKYEKENCDKITTFHCNGKEWVWLDAFKEDANIILELIATYRHVRFVPSEDEDFVNVVYKYYNRCPKDQKAKFDQLLDLIYFDFQKRHITDSANQETKILKTYVTTTLFEALQKLHITAKTVSQQMVNTLTLPPELLPTLCEYQKKSVLWLLMRERETTKFPAFFEKLCSKDGQTVVYKHLYSTYIQTDPPPDLCLPPGGILADEMGLGKTVQMLSLILLNPRNDASPYEFPLESFNKKRTKNTNVYCICTSNLQKNIIQCNKCFIWQHKLCVGHDNDYEDDLDKPYLCPCCWQIKIDECGLIRTKATFIVTPNIIKLQWYSEIKRHINPSLRVLLYEGVLGRKWVSPWELSEYDIILTDYRVLRNEIYYTQDNVSERTTRNKPRSMRMNSPILMMDWWRVLLDEAQMVESNTSNTATMVRKITAVNRWAVTGTPIQKSLNDLRPFLQFIGFEAVNDTPTWNFLVNDFLLQQDKENSEGGEGDGTDGTVPELINVLQKCMWRTCKIQIASELNIPPQTEIIHRIEFDNLEKLFYNEQHLECRSNFMVNVNRFTNRMTTISPRIMQTILQPFLKIRQSCTIPVVITSLGFNSTISQQQKQFLQPKELHNYLKSTHELSCKTDLRSMASSHNGLAALYFLEKEYDQAIKHYEAVLKLAKDYNHMNVAVDSLLQIHALHNLMQIKIIKNNESKDLFLETYETQLNALEWKYLETYASTLATVKLSYESAVNKINEETEETFVNSTANGVETLLPSDKTILLKKIHEECLPQFGQKNLKLSEIASTRGLIYVVLKWFQKLSKILKNVSSEIAALKYFTENVRSRNQVSPEIWKQVMFLVNTVYDCHLSEIREVQEHPRKKLKKSETEKKKLCKLCHIRNSMNEFECLLFDKVIDKTNTNYTDGLEKHSFEMFLCKLILNFLKSKNRVSSEVVEKKWLYLENLQLVCKRLIKLWIEMEYTIKAYDELDMCKMRITLTKDPEDKSIFKIMEQDIDGRIQEQQIEIMDAQTQFTVKLARLKYIKHLEGDDDPGACPICRLTEDDRYAVLECGHHICYPCLKSILQYAKGCSMIKCAICRNVQQNRNLYYVSRSKTKTNKGPNINGDYSSKITYIVRLILKLINEETDKQDENSDIKIIIFSQWDPILLSIALALKENDIKFRAQCTAKTIAEFKNPHLGITCLLMPFIRGSKGLNLVEATHVFLVEPILNPGEELQAIGRVHRFGQTKTTTVHRFIVSDSIEENIYNFIISSASSNSKGIQSQWEFDKISLKDFENLFSLQQKNDC